MFRSFSYTRSILGAEEKVIFATSLHWIIYQSGILNILLGLIVVAIEPVVLEHLAEPDLVATAGKPVLYGGFAWCAFGLYQTASAFFLQYGTELVVTDHRFIAKFGVISRMSFEIHLNKIEGSDLFQTAWGRILGYGTIMVRGVGTNLEPFNYIDNPSALQNALLTQMRKKEEAEEKA